MPFPILLRDSTVYAYNTIQSFSSIRKLSTNSQVTTEEAEQRSTELNIMFIETSAKLAFNVKTLFRKIAQALPGMEREGESGAAAAGNQSELIRVSRYLVVKMLTDPIASLVK